MKIITTICLLILLVVISGCPAPDDAPGPLVFGAITDTMGAFGVTDVETIVPPVPDAVERTVERENAPPVPVPVAILDVPLRLEITEAPKAPRLPFRVTVTGYSAEDVFGAGWCSNCIADKHSLKDGDANIKLDWSRGSAPVPSNNYPCYVWKDASGTNRWVAGRQTFPQLWGMIQRNNPPDGQREASPQSSPSSASSGFHYAVSGKAGTLHGKVKVVAAMAWVRENVGEGVQTKFAWGRTGAQLFPLLKGGDWSTLALFGRSGHIYVSAVGSKLPMYAAGFTYLVVGKDITFDLDPITIEDLANRLGPDTVGDFKTGDRVGFEPLTLLAIFSVMRSIWNIFHTTVDLTLGGNVSASAVLQGGMLSVDFTEMPGIKITPIFDFNLSIKRIELTESQVRVLFAGSRWIKERTFSID